MAFVIADSVKETTSGTPGTGTINLAGPVAGFRGFVAGIGNGNTCPVTIEASNGTDFEHSVVTVTDATPDTLSSRTLYASSTGSLLDLSSGTHTVYCGWLAQHAQQSLLYQVAGTDANTTMAVGQMYVVDMSAWATADRTYTLPATAAVGDRVGIMVGAGDASHELIITANTGDTLNGIAGGTEWSRLFITGEVVIMCCTAANAAWMIEVDGRIRMHAVMRLSTSVTTNSAGTYYFPTDNSGAWTADQDVGSIVDTATGKFTFRRACKGTYTITGTSNSALGDGTYFHAYAHLNNTTYLQGATNLCAAAGGAQVSANTTGKYTFALNDYIRYITRTAEANKGLLSDASSLYSSLQFTEVF